MADDLDLFDIDTTKKKKKKKKTTFEDYVPPASEETAKKPEAAIEEPGASQTSERVENFDDDFSLRKKKKKKKPILEDDVLSVPTAGETAAPPAEEQIQEDFSLTKKKKKKKAALTIEEAQESEIKVEGDEPKIGNEDDFLDEEEEEELGTLWGGSDRDYKYQELLERVFEIMRAKNPDMVAGEKKRFVLKPPQVVRIGSKKTSFVNFTEICKMIHRQPKHLLAFLLAELGTSGSVDGNNMLIIKGRFQQRQIEAVLRRYIKEYVTCHTCRSPETLLQKETRLFFLQCEKCGSRCSVASIKSGFQAMTGKRAAARAKQQ